MKYNRVLTIAGSDSGGGAGIQADIKTISALGCYAASAITAVTVQNTVGVTGVHAMPIDILRGQIDAVLSDIGADAVKIGMLHSGEVIKTVREMLDKYEIRNVVLDPVMVATSGDRLIEEEAVEELKKTLIPRARVITPNIPEAEVILGEKISGQEDLPMFAKRLSQMAFSLAPEEDRENVKVSVLLKAGHLKDDKLVDIFYNAETDEIIPLESQRLYTPNTHGTGCTLSSAFAAHLAKGCTLNEAAKGAKDYIAGAIEAGAAYEIGHGHGPVKHFWNLWK